MDSKRNENSDLENTLRLKWKTYDDSSLESTPKRKKKLSNSGKYGLDNETFIELDEQNRAFEPEQDEENFNYIYDKEVTEMTTVKLLELMARSDEISYFISMADLNVEWHYAFRN